MRPRSWGAIGATLGLLLAAGAARAAPVSWLTYGFGPQRTGYNPDETTIGTRNAGNLHRLWADDLGDVMIAQPVEAAGVVIGGVARNVVYEGTEHGQLFAIDASDGHVLWRKGLGAVTTSCPDMPDSVYGIGGAGAISFTAPGAGAIYVAGGDGAVHALDLATGAELPGWPVTGVFDPTELHVYGGVNLFGGELYVADASHCDAEPFYSTVTEIDVGSHAIVNRFYPAGPPSGGISGGGIWGPGGVAVEPSTGDVFAATGNALTTPENYRYSDAIVKLSPSLAPLSALKPAIPGRDVDFGATPILFRPSGCPTALLAAENKTGMLFVDTLGNLASGPEQALQITNTSNLRFTGIPAWDPHTNMLYVASSADASSGPYRHGLIALAASGCTLSLAWQDTVGPQPVNPSPPTVADGVVYYGDGPGNTEYAFNAATGKQLWSSGTTISGPVFAAPTVVNGQLLVAAWDHRLYAFGP